MRNKCDSSRKLICGTLALVLSFTRAMDIAGLNIPVQPSVDIRCGSRDGLRVTNNTPMTRRGHVRQVSPQVLSKTLVRVVFLAPI